MLWTLFYRTPSDGNDANLTLQLKSANGKMAFHQERNKKDYE